MCLVLNNVGYLLQHHGGTNERGAGEVAKFALRFAVNTTWTTLKSVDFEDLVNAICGGKPEECICATEQRYKGDLQG